MAVSEHPVEVATGLDSLIFHRLSMLAKHLERQLAKLVDDRFGLAVAEYRVLAQVSMHPESTMRAIIGRTLIDKGQVSRTVASLEKRGLILRSAPNAVRRSPVFTVTPAGAKLMEQIVPLRREQEAELLARLAARDVRTLDRVLDALLAYFHDDESAARRRMNRRDVPASDRP